MLKEERLFDMASNDLVLPHRHEEKMDEDLMEVLQEEMGFLDDSQAKEQATVLRVATGRQWTQLRKSAKAGAEVPETDFMHLDPLANFFQMPTAEENKEPPSYDMKQQLQTAIANANKDRSLYSGRVDKKQPMSYARKIDWYTSETARMSRAAADPWAQ